MDPRGLSLRRLVWMADARREFEVDCVIATVRFFGQSFNGTFRPDRANPFRDERPAVKLTPEQEAAESEEGWALIDAALREQLASRGQ